MNSLGKYVLTKTQKIVLLVVVFALIAGGYYAGFYLPVQRRIEAADTAELDAQIQLEQMKAMQIRQMEEEIEENKASNAPMVPAYNHFKTETEELNRIFANAYDFTFQYSEPQVDGMEIRRAMNISFTADSFDHAVSMLHEVVEGPYRCLIEDLSIQDDKDLENEELEDIRIHPVAAALLFFVFCGVGASIILASASASAGKIRHLPREDQKRYAVDSAAAFLRDELQKTENIVKIKEVIVHDSRDDEEDDEDDFYCYYVGSRKNTDNEATWQKFYGTDSGLSSAESANSAILDSLIVDIYRNNEYRKLADGENASEEEIAYKDFTLSVKKAGTSGNTIDPLKTSVRLWMTDDYKIKAVISDTVTADDKKEERCEKRLELEAAHSSESETVTVAGDDGDSDDDDSYTITTTTIITTIRWQNGTIEKELLQDDK